MGARLSERHLRWQQDVGARTKVLGWDVVVRKTLVLVLAPLLTS